MISKKELQDKSLVHLDAVVPHALYYQYRKMAIEKGSTATRLIIDALTRYMEEVKNN